MGMKRHSLGCLNECMENWAGRWLFWAAEEPQLNLAGNPKCGDFIWVNKDWNPKQNNQTGQVSGPSRAEEATLHTEAEQCEPEAVAAGPVISGRYGRDDKLWLLQ